MGVDVEIRSDRPCTLDVTTSEGQARLRQDIKKPDPMHSWYMLRRFVLGGESLPELLHECKYVLSSEWYPPLNQ